MSYEFQSLLSHSRSIHLSQKKIDFLDSLQGIPPLIKVLNLTCVKKIKSVKNIFYQGCFLINSKVNVYKLFIKTVS